MLKTNIFIKFYKSSWQQLRNYAVKSEMKTFTQKKLHYGDLFPDKLLNKKQKTPPILYIANEEAAKIIDKSLSGYFYESNCDTILEMNPGIGLFTRKLLDREEKFKKILLMESSDHFMKNLHEMHSLYPERVKVKHCDLTNMGKLVYQDKLDNGSRLQELLRDVPRREQNEDANMIMFGAVGSYYFFKQLINSVIFRQSLLSMGRTEMFFIIPPPIYLHLTCTSEIGYMIYRSTTILFQILFEYQFITRLPREHFLPAQTDYNITTSSKLKKVRSVNPEYVYLVRMIPRQNIHDVVAPEDLPALWYFIKQNCISRRNRIIPNLEKWIPGCGPRLIINSHNVETAKPLYDYEDIRKLPKYSSQCMTISNRDFYPNVNIYTQFGDLTPSQFLTLFSTFRTWPEYKESSFLASFENSMLKMESSAEDAVDSIVEEDDEDTDLANLDEKKENIDSKDSLMPDEAVKKSARRSKNAKET